MAQSVFPMLKENAPRIRTEVQVMFFDTDCAAVVHNIAYLRFIEVARTLLAEELGLGLAAMAETQKYPVVVRTEIDYRRAAKLGDRLVVGVRVVRKTEDIGSTLIAVAVGALITLGPLALLQSG